MAGLSRGQVFIYVYRLAMDARTLEGVMVWVAENIQACLRIFRRAQHQWLVRDILHRAQGVYSVFVLWPPQEYSNEEPILRRTALQAEAWSESLLPEGIAPGYSW